MRTISLRTSVAALVALAALACAVEVAQAQGDGDTAAHEVGHWLAKFSVPPQVARGTINHDEPVTYWFHAELRIFDDGRARGSIQLREVGGPRTLLFRAVGWEVIDDRESGPTLALLLAQVGEDGEPLGLLSRAELEPDRVVCFSDRGDIICLIYFTD